MMPLAARPDLQAALQTIQQSETNHKLAISNGSTDPTYQRVVHVQLLDQQSEWPSRLSASA